MKKFITYFGLSLAAAFAVFIVAGPAHAQTMGGYGSYGSGSYGSMMGGWAYPSSGAVMSASDTAMHVALGERYSGCNANAALPGAWSTPGQNNNPFYNMMGYGYGGYGPMAGYGYGGWDPFGFLWGIFWAAILIFALVVLVRWARAGRRRGWRHGWPTGERSAIDILRERYAKGEIDRKEFEEKKKDLET